MILHITPVAKVRMVRSDAWRGRECVKRYWEFKDELKRLTEDVGYEVPDVLEGITFVLPMPKSWSKKKKAALLGQPHTQRPDLDNLVKSFQDCLCKEDSHVHTFHNIRKIWDETGYIII